jgi:hypothetical protein
MSLEIIVVALAVLGYAAGSYADERRSKRYGGRLTPLRDGRAERPRLPLPSAP